MASITVIYDDREDLDKIDMAKVDDDYAQHLIVMAECVCCQNNWNDPDGHKHGRHCYG